MKYVMMVLGLVIASDALARDVYVKPHFRSNGEYVQPHHRTSPNNTTLDNYSTQGNINPYTGSTGTVSPYQPFKPTW